MSVCGDNNLPTILLGIVVACLTILISIAVAIFSEKKEFEALDRNVILDHVIKAKYLLFFLGLTFFPLFFWNGPLPCTRLLVLICWFVGLVLILKVLNGCYHWMKGNKFQLRFSYLSKLQNREDIEEAWRSVWQTEKINIQNEQQFFNIFHTAVGSCLENNNQNNLVIASKLLNDFNSFIDKRSTEFLILLNGTLDKILQWHFEIWGKEYEYLSQEDKLETWAIYNELSRIIDSIIQKIELRALKSTKSFSFFKKFENHAEQYKNEQHKNEYKYADSLFDIFYQVYFENIYGAPSRYNIWEHYFPDEWKVTKNNLKNPKNIIAAISLNKFLDWARDRIWEASNEKDFLLEDISTNLFPEVDPTLWAKILIFIYTPYGDDRLSTVVEKSWNFGLFGRVKVYNKEHQKDEIERDKKNEEINTFDLAVLVFGKQFSKINLKSYIHSLEQLSYPKQPAEESKRLQLLHLFQNMLKYLHNSDSST